MIVAVFIFIVICSSLYKTITSEIYNNESIIRTGDNITKTYIDSKGVERDIETNAPVMHIYYSPESDGHLYSEFYLNGKRMCRLPERGDHLITYFLDHGYRMPRNIDKYTKQCYLNHYKPPLNVDAQRRVIQAEFFKNHPEYNVTAIQWGEGKNSGDPVPGKRYFDVITHEVYVIRTIKDINIEVYCHYHTGEIIRKTDGQIRKDLDNVNNKKNTGEWIDSISAEYIDNIKWNELLSKIKNDKTVLLEWWKSNKLESYEELYRKTSHTKYKF